MVNSGCLLAETGVIDDRTNVTENILLAIYTITRRYITELVVNYYSTVKTRVTNSDFDHLPTISTDATP